MPHRLSKYLALQATPSHPSLDVVRREEFSETLYLVFAKNILDIPRQTYYPRNHLYCCCFTDGRPVPVELKCIRPKCLQPLNLRAEVTVYLANWCTVSRQACFTRGFRAANDGLDMMTRKSVQFPEMPRAKIRA
jgi:hypothetical protein